MSNLSKLRRFGLLIAQTAAGPVPCGRALPHMTVIMVKVLLRLLISTRERSVLPCSGGSRLGLPAAIHQRNRHLRLKQLLPSRITPWPSSTRAPASSTKARFHLQQIVEPRRLQEIADHAADHETGAPVQLRSGGCRAAAGSPTGPARRISGNWRGRPRRRKIRVLVIDADRQDVDAIPSMRPARSGQRSVIAPRPAAGCLA